MTYTEISASDSNFNNYTSFSDHNSTMNFIIGTLGAVNGKAIDLNDNEYI